MPGILPTIARMKAGKTGINPNYNPEDPNSSPFAKQNVGFWEARFGVDDPTVNANIQYRLDQLRNAQAEKMADKEWQRRLELAGQESVNSISQQEQDNFNRMQAVKTAFERQQKLEQEARDERAKDKLQAQINLAGNREAESIYADRARQQEAEIAANADVKALDAAVKYLAPILGISQAQLAAQGTQMIKAGQSTAGPIARQRLLQGQDIIESKRPELKAYGSNLAVMDPNRVGVSLYGDVPNYMKMQDGTVVPFGTKFGQVEDIQPAISPDEVAKFSPTTKPTVSPVAKYMPEKYAISKEEYSKPVAYGPMAPHQFDSEMQAFKSAMSGASPESAKRIPYLAAEVLGKKPEQIGSSIFTRQAKLTEEELNKLPFAVKAEIARKLAREFAK